MPNLMETADSHPGIETTWQAHPARERLGSALVAAGVVLGAAAAAGWAAASLGWGLASAAVLTLSLHRFFFPSRFSIDDEGLAACYLLSRKRLRWSEIRRFVCDRRGGYLSTRRQPSRLDAYRGLHILFGGRRDELVPQIRSRLARVEGDACAG